MTAIQSKSRDAELCNQILSGRWKFTPNARELLPCIRSLTEGWGASSTLPRDGEQAWKPAIEPPGVSPKQMAPSENAQIGDISVEKLLHGFIAHETVWMGEIRQKADRAATPSASKATDDNEQHQCSQN